MVTKKISQLFDDDQYEVLYPEESFDFHILAGRIHGQKVFTLTNRKTPGPGTPMTRISRVIETVNSATKNSTPLIWCISGLSETLSSGLKMPPHYPEFFIGQEIGSGPFFRAIANHKAKTLQIGILDDDITSSRTLMVSFCDTYFLQEKSNLSVGQKATQGVLNRFDDSKMLGPIDVHKNFTGICTHSYSTRIQANLLVRKLFIPDSNNFEYIRKEIPDVPDRADVPMDMHKIVDFVADRDSFFELWPDYAGEVICGLASIEGKRVSLFGNNSRKMGGFLTRPAFDKICRFLDLSTKINLPLVGLLDCAGIYSDSESEKTGIVESAAHVMTKLSQYAKSVQCVIVRRAYSAGIFLMGGVGFCGRKMYALPSAKVSIYGPKLLHKEVNSIRSDQVGHFEEMLSIHDNPEKLEKDGFLEIVELDAIRKKLAGEIS